MQSSVDKQADAAGSSELEQGEDGVWLELVGAPQLFELDDDHALQDLGLQLLQQLAGGVQSPCNTRATAALTGPACPHPTGCRRRLLVGRYANELLIISHLQ